LAKFVQRLFLHKNGLHLLRWATLSRECHASCNLRDSGLQSQKTLKQKSAEIRDQCTILLTLSISR
jgi:hypothetical protein